MMAPPPLALRCGIAARLARKCGRRFPSDDPPEFLQGLVLDRGDSADAGADDDSIEPTHGLGRRRGHPRHIRLLGRIPGGIAGGPQGRELARRLTQPLLPAAR